MITKIGNDMLNFITKPAHWFGKGADWLGNKIGTGLVNSQEPFGRFMAESGSDGWWFKTLPLALLGSVYAADSIINPMEYVNPESNAVIQTSIGNGAIPTGYKRVM